MKLLLPAFSVNAKNIPITLARGQLHRSCTNAWTIAGHRSRPAGDDHHGFQRITSW